MKLLLVVAALLSATPSFATSVQRYFKEADCRMEYKKGPVEGYNVEIYLDIMTKRKHALVSPVCRACRLKPPRPIPVDTDIVGTQLLYRGEEFALDVSLESVAIPRPGSRNAARVTLPGISKILYGSCLLSSRN